MDDDSGDNGRNELTSEWGNESEDICIVQTNTTYSVY